MKKLILVMMFILSLPLAFALYGGDTITYNFPECRELKVNITATDKIDLGEYIVLNDCTENKTNYWICDCEDNYNFSVKFDIASVNNFTFVFNYMYEGEIHEQSNGGSSGGGGGSSRSRTSVCTPYWKCTEWTNCQPNSKATRSCTDLNECNTTRPTEERYCYYYIAPVEEPIEETGITEEQITLEEEPEETKKSWLWLYIIIGLIVLLGIGGFIYWYFYYEKKQEQIHKPNGR